MKKKYPNTFQIISQKRFWPHIDGTGGFFVARIMKIGSIETRETTRPENSNTKIQKVSHTVLEGRLKPNISVYSHEEKLLAVIKNQNFEKIKEKYYFMRLGEKFGQTEK